MAKKWIKNGQLAISSVVAAEFLAGATDKEAEIFEALLEQFGTLPVDTVVARMAANYRKRFLKEKKKLRLPDCLIAATCKVYQATLVTLDTSDYPMKDIKIFRQPKS